MKKLLLPIALIILSCSKDEVCDTTPNFGALTSKDISYDLVTISGQITQAECDNNLISKGLAYSTNELPTTSDSKLAISEASFSKELNNLLPSTVYYVRPYLTNSDGDFYGNQITFTTLGDDIQFSNLVTTPSISKISVSASFSFQQGEGIVTTSKGVEFNGEQIFDDSEENSISIELAELEPNSEYTFKLFVTNKFGTTLSEPIVVSTEDYGSVFGSISVEKINPATVSLSASYEVDYSGDEITTRKGFIISVSDNFDDGTEIVLESNLDSANIVGEVSGLTHNNTYYCKAFIENEYGTVYSDAITFSTIDATIEISEPTVSKLSWCCATVTSNVSESSEYVNEWGFQLSKDKSWSDNTYQSYKSTEIFSPLSSGSLQIEFSYVFEDLENPVQYYIRAYVINDYGTYYSSTVDFDTPERLDSDGDGIFDDQDNCINTPNSDQNDFDGDGIGDACDDSDGDGINDSEDNCKETANKNQEDNDSDGIGDVCDPDDDNDGVNDDEDNCINTYNPEQEDYDNDGVGDVCDDSDGDGITDDKDNCVDTANTDQKDTDGDGIGDVCDDSDGDGINDDIDNCINTSNPEQEDFDDDGIGDVCDDSDNDNVLDSVDNCREIYNPNQEDTDGDGIGDYCDEDSLFYVPDNAFESYLEGENYNNDDYVIAHYTKNITSLGTVDDIWSGGQYVNFASSQQRGIGVKDLRGIESLINLEEIYLRIESISSIDLSKNTKLKKVRIYSYGYNPGPDLASIDFPENNDIEILNLYSSIEDFQLSKFSNLKKLSIGGNARIENLDTSNLESLTFLQANFFEMDYSNNFKGGIINSPDLSNNTLLETLIIQEAQFESLDLSMLYSLTKADFNTWDALKLRCIKVNQETYNRIQKQNGVGNWFGYKGDGSSWPAPSFTTTITTGSCN